MQSNRKSNRQSRSIASTSLRFAQDDSNLRAQDDKQYRTQDDKHYWRSVTSNFGARMTS